MNAHAKKFGLLTTWFFVYSCGGQQTSFHGSTGTVQEPPPAPSPPVSAEAVPQEPPLPVVEPELPAKAPVVAPPPVQPPLPPPPVPPVKAPSLPEPGLEVKKPLRQVTWLWQCQATTPGGPVTPPAPTQTPQPEDGTAVILGAGTHVLDRDVSQGTNVTLAGDLCAPEVQPRDLFFVIDTSASMDGNDPFENNTCGRVQGVEAVLKSLAVGENQMGILTFSSSVNLFTNQFYKKPTELYAALAPQGNTAEVICGEDGTTNYQAAMIKAGEILALGRPQATKELFFISDGEPNGGEDGIVEAASLKNPGVTIGGKSYPVTIATIMLNGTDTVLQNSIASKDSAGKPLHVLVNQASQLAKALSDLAENPIVKASMKYRSKAQANFREVDLLATADNKKFQLPAITFTFQEMKDGIEVIYQYTNKRGQTSQSTGMITIGATAPTPAPTPKP